MPVRCSGRRSRRPIADPSPPTWMSPLGDDYSAQGQRQPVL